MKKLIFTLCTVCAFFFSSNAQYCGGSGTSVCTSNGSLMEPGLAPKPDSLDAVVNGSSTPVVVQFKNYDTLTFQGNVLHVISLRIDSIVNLPSGLCWATNKADNTYATTEDGCIKISGTTCAATGQYKLGIYVTANTQELGEVPTNASAAGLFYFVRVINTGDVAPAVDTANEYLPSSNFKPYGGACTVGINDVKGPVASLSIVPNPMNGKAVVSFVTDNAATVTEKLTNMIGSVVYSREFAVKAGENTSTIDRGTLPTGVYFYTIGSGNNVVTKRLVISE